VRSRTWFAVTALFKHPLGIPIPHTAIIKRKKDQLGEGLGSFVRENFLSPEWWAPRSAMRRSRAGWASGSRKPRTRSGSRRVGHRAAGFWWNCCATTTFST